MTANNNTTSTQHKSFLTGHNPIDPTLVLSLFLVQVVLIVSLSRLLSFLLIKLKQPRVISEVIGGIILGTSVLGQIPGFTNTIFPPVSLPFLKLVADFGLIFFLFLVGLELDPRILKQNARRAFAVSLSGIIVPFALGIGVGYLLYEILMDEESSSGFGTFVLFIGVAMSITAFPVLARILAERKLFSSVVGYVTVSAAAVDDIVAWILLAIVVSLINASSPIDALYTLLAAIAWGLILLFIVRPLLNHAARLSKARDLDSAMVVIIFMTILVSAWMTEAIGIHAIFGAFLVGLITPRENSFPVKISEKIEDFVGVLFLPLYFAYSGLRTNLSQLNDGTVWGLFFLTLVCTCVGKIVGCGLASRYSGMTWRESWTVGVLMNTKGLVELIVLNLGLDAGVINSRIFVVLVLVALITTFMTTPLVTYIYPSHLHRPATVLINKKQNNRFATVEDIENIMLVHGRKTGLRMLVCVWDVVPLKTMFSLIQTLQSYYRSLPTSTDTLNSFEGQTKHSGQQLELHALRLMQLSDRTSSLLSRLDVTATVSRDPILGTFRTYAQLQGADFRSSLAVTDYTEFGDTILRTSQLVHANIILLPWEPSSYDSQTNILESWLEDRSDGLPVTVSEKRYLGIVSTVFEEANCTVGVVIDRTGQKSEQDEDIELDDNSHEEEDVNGLTSKYVSEHDGNIKPSTILIPFFGGPDDREALMFGVRFATKKGVNVRVIRLRIIKDSYKEYMTDAFHASGEDGPNAMAEKHNLKDYVMTKQQDLNEMDSNHTIQLDTEGEVVQNLPHDSAEQSEEEVPTLPEVTYEALRPCLTDSPGSIDIDHEDERYITHLRDHIQPLVPPSEVRPFVIPLHRRTTDPGPFQRMRRLSSSIAGSLHLSRSDTPDSAQTIDWNTHSLSAPAGQFGVPLNRTLSLPGVMFSDTVPASRTENEDKVPGKLRRWLSSASGSRKKRVRSASADAAIQQAEDDRAMNAIMNDMVPEMMAVSDQDLADAGITQERHPNQRSNSRGGVSNILHRSATTLSTLTANDGHRNNGNNNGTSSSPWERRRFSSAFSFLRRENAQDMGFDSNPKQIRNIEVEEVECDDGVGWVLREAGKMSKHDLIVIGVEGTGRKTLADIQRQHDTHSSHHHHHHHHHHHSFPGFHHDKDCQKDEEHVGTSGKDKEDTQHSHVHQRDEANVRDRSLGELGSRLIAAAGRPSIVIVRSRRKSKSKK